MMSNLWGFYYCCCLWHHLYEISARTKTSRSTFAFALTFRYLIHFVLIHVYKMWMGQPHSAWILNCYTSHFWRGTAGTSVLQSLLLTGAHLPTQPQSVAGTRCHMSTEATIASHSEASLAGTSHSPQLPLSTECCPTLQHNWACAGWSAIQNVDVLTAPPPI